MSKNDVGRLQIWVITLVTLVDRCAWCWSAADKRCLATRELLGEILVVGLPKPFTSGEQVKAIREDGPRCAGQSL